MWKLKSFFNRLRRSLRWAIRMWGNYDFDYAYLLRVMSWKMEDMQKFMTKHGSVSDSDKIAREMHVCCLLIDRFLNKDYFEGTMFDKSNNKRFEREDYMVKQDLTYMLEIMRKKLRTWWD